MVQEVSEMRHVNTPFSCLVYCCERGCKVLSMTLSRDVNKAPRRNKYVVLKGMHFIIL